MAAAALAVLPSAADLAATLAWALDLTIKATVLLAASWAGAIVLRRGTAAARHQLWALGVAGALLLPLLAAALPPVPVLARAWPALSLTSTATSPAASAAATSIAPAPAVAPTSSTAPAASVATAAHPATADAAAAPIAAPAWPAFLALLWLAGTLLVALRLVRGHLAARRLARTTDLPLPAAWSTAAHDAALALGLTGPVRLGRSAAIRSPMTVGVRRPRVLLPAAAVDWTAARLRAVLTHELGHVARRDTLVQLAAQLACALHWWSPLPWLAAARLRVEREHACDDLVLAAGVPASAYATDLLDVARFMSPADAPVGAIGMVAPSWTETRLRRVLDATAPRAPLGRRFRAASSAVALAACALLACTSAPDATASSASPTAVAAVAPAAAASAPAAVAAAAAIAAPSPAGPRGVVTGPAADTDGTLDGPVRASAVDPRRPFFAPAPSFSVDGALAEPVIDREVARHLPALEQCYRQRLLARPELAGQVVVHWTISAAGAVVEQCVTEDTVGDPAVLACVNALVAATTYPAPATGTVKVSYPFTFKPRPDC